MSDLPVLPKAFVLEHERQRIITAITVEIDTHGYAGAKIAGIVKTAGVARKTFYDIFAGKEEGARATVQAGIDRALDAAAAAAAAGPTGTSAEARLEAGLTAVLKLAAAEPGTARLLLHEAPTFALDLHGAMLQSFADLIGYPGANARTMVAGGVAEVLQRELRAGRDPRQLQAELAEFAIRPWVGEDTGAYAAQA